MDKEGRSRRVGHLQKERIEPSHSLAALPTVNFSRNHTTAAMPQCCMLAGIPPPPAAGRVPGLAAEDDEAVDVEDEAEAEAEAEVDGDAGGLVSNEMAVYRWADA